LEWVVTLWGTNRGKSVAFAFVTVGNKKPAGKTAGFKF
jgi:hypothetical protein